MKKKNTIPNTKVSEVMPFPRLPLIDGMRILMRMLLSSAMFKICGEDTESKYEEAMAKLYSVSSHFQFNNEQTIDTERYT